MLYLFIMEEHNMKACGICFENHIECANFKFIPLSTTDENNESYLTKIQYMALEDFKVFQETSEICPTCSEALNKSYEFRKKIVIAIEFWENWQSKMEMQDVEGVENSVFEVSTDGDLDKVYSNEVSVQPSSEIAARADTFVCEVCLQIYQKKSDMLHHVCSKNSEVISPKTETFSDDSCEIKSVFEYRVGKVHTAPKVYLCTICNKVFKHSYSLRDHLTSHTGERNYSCDICNKTFHHMSSQTRHMQTHLAPPGEKTKKSPFLCSICGKSFPYSNGFQRHMRTHVAEKPHQCNICDRTFSQSTHLKVHLRTHSGEKPYMCYVCNASFSLKATLRKHMKGHKDSEDYVKMVHTLEPNLGQAKES